MCLGHGWVSEFFPYLSQSRILKQIFLHARFFQGLRLLLVDHGFVTLSLLGLDYRIGGSHGEFIQMFLVLVLGILAPL